MNAKWQWVVDLVGCQFRGRSASRAKAQYAIERRLTELGTEWKYMAYNEERTRFMYYPDWEPLPEASPIAIIWLGEA